ncbi:MAG: hypothetical protein M5U34_34010 [Chloroflexi bacterium]|nr:hypothetical protein [Chloroflexota bacterium]
MPTFVTGNMWIPIVADLFLITTNSTLTRPNKLVMGRGIALQAKERFPGLDTALGRQIGTACGSYGGLEKTAVLPLVEQLPHTILTQPKRYIRWTA